MTIKKRLSHIKRRMTHEKDKKGSSCSFTAVAMAAVSAVPAMADEIKDLYDYESGKRDWDLERLYSQQATDLQVLTNLYDGLLESDEYGKLVPAVAELGDRGQRCYLTFHLRQGVKWVDQERKWEGWSYCTGLLNRTWVGIKLPQHDATNTHADGDDRWC